MPITAISYVLTYSKDYPLCLAVSADRGLQVRVL